jgi:LysR family transcriptional regulator, glycine cleavage system transcriptional activator
MRHHQAPVAAMRALEVAARHLSFTRAAEELNITQSAVSHQIRHLEELWDLKLFERRARRLELTSAGSALAPVMREFFNRLEEALDILKANDGPTALRVEVLPSLAAKWLVPLLPQFRAANPEIDVWMLTSAHQLTDLQGREIDLAVHMGDGNYPGMDSRFFMDEAVFPVCRPRFLDEHGRPKSPVDLCRFPLLLRHEEILTPTWEFWFESVGVTEDVYRAALSEGIHYPDSNTALQAAFEGHGIALGRRAHVWDDVKSGRLVRLFPEIEVPFNLDYYTVCPPNRAGLPAVQEFRAWLEAEGAAAMTDYNTLKK